MIWVVILHKPESIWVDLLTEWNMALTWDVYIHHYAIKHTLVLPFQLNFCPDMDLCWMWMLGSRLVTRFLTPFSEAKLMTMYQLRNVVNRWNVLSDPKDEAACEDFMNHHWCTCTYLHNGAILDGFIDTPSNKFFPDGTTELDSLQQRNILLLAAEQLVEKYVDLSIPK